MKAVDLEWDEHESLLGDEVQGHRQNYGALSHHNDFEAEFDDQVKSASVLSLLQRFIVRGNILESALQKLLLVRNVLYKQERRGEPLSHRLFLSNTIAVPDDSARSMIKSLSHTTQGLRISSQNIWPFVLSGLIAQDAMQFLVKPSRRYGTTSLELMTGLYRRDWALASGQFPGFPNEAPFWLLPGGMLLLPILSTLLENVLQSQMMTQDSRITQALEEMIVQKPARAVLPYSSYRRALKAATFILAWDKRPEFAHQRQGWLERIEHIALKGALLPALSAMSALASLADSPLNYAYPRLDLLRAQIQTDFEPAEQALRFLTSLSEHKGARAEAARFHLWSLGQNSPEQKANRLRYFLYSMQQLSLLGFSAYAGYRYALILVQRGMQAHEFFKQQHHCQQQYKTWHYSILSGDYMCSIGGNYSFVPPSRVNDAQGCLDALLGAPRPIEEVLKALSHFRHFTGFNQADFTSWLGNSSRWENNTMTEIFAETLALSPNWTVVNISSSASNTAQPFNDDLVEIGNILSRVMVSQFDCSGLKWGAQNWYQFLQAWQPKSGLDVFWANNNNLDEADLYAFSNWSRNHSLALTQINFAHNAIQDEAGIAFLKNMPASVSELDLSSNGLSSIFGNALANQLSGSSLERLILSNNDLSNTDYAAFGRAISASNLTVLELNSVNLQNFDLAEFGEALSNQTQLKFFSISGNQLNAEGVRYFASSGGSMLQTVDFSNNELKDDDLQSIMSLLNQTDWQVIDLSNNLFSSEAVAQFWSSLITNTSYSVGMAGMGLNSQAFDPLLSLLANNSVRSALNVGRNDLTDAFAAALLNTACLANVSRINLSLNSLTATFDDIATWPLSNYTCTDIDLSDNTFTGEKIMPLLHHLPEFKSLQRLNLDGVVAFDQNTARTLAAALITPMPNPDDLDHLTVSSDELRALHRAKPSTSLVFFSMNDTFLNQDAALPLCNIAPHLPDLEIYAMNNGFSINPFESCQTSAASRLHPFGTGVSSGLALSVIPIINLLAFAWLLYELTRAVVARCATPFREERSITRQQEGTTKKSINHATYAMNI